MQKKFVVPVIILITGVLMNIVTGGCMNGPYGPGPIRPSVAPVQDIAVNGPVYISALKCVTNLNSVSNEDKSMALNLITIGEDALKSAKDGTTIFANSKDIEYFKSKYPACSFSGI